MRPYIYISGPITNNPNYHQQFSACVEFIKREGMYTPLNPVTQVCDILDRNNIHAPKWRDYMKAALIVMMQSGCKDIIMLKGYQDSKGALTEYEYAYFLGYRIHVFLDGVKCTKKRMCLNKE